MNGKRTQKPLPFCGTAQRTFCHFVAENWQDVDYAKKYDISVKIQVSTLNTWKTLQNMALCRELRRVCRLSGSKRRPFTLLTKKSYRDRASDPAAESSRRARIFGLVLAISALAPPALAENWQRGSSFGADAANVVWSKSGFGELPPKLKAAPAAKAAKHALSFTYDPTLTPVANLRNLISCAESGSMNYDAVVYDASVAPPALPTLLTIGQIKAWVIATPGQNHAIGRYQFIPATFNRLADITQVPDEALFTADLQDRWANKLIQEARYLDFVAGRLSPTGFMDNIAQVWAGLPLASGKSAYDGTGDNHATIARPAFEQSMAIIFPAQVAFAASLAQNTGPK